MRRGLPLFFSSKHFGDMCMTPQETEPTRRNAHVNQGSQTSSKVAAVAVGNMQQHHRAPWLYCYPRARAHSSLLTCCSAVDGLGALWPQRLRNGISYGALNLALSPRSRGASMKKLKALKGEEVPVDEQLLQRVYPHCQMTLVSDSTASMVGAVLEYLCTPSGTVVFLPGLLLHSHFQLLDLFDLWKLRVVGYDVDFVTMCVDEKDLREKASNLGMIGRTKKTSTGHGSGSPLLLLMGINGRFIVNAGNVVSFARTELSALTLELHPITVPSFGHDSVGAGLAPLHADVHITSMDAAGELGGAVAFAADPLLAHGILLSLQKRPAAETRRHWVALAQHVAHLLISDGVSFQALRCGMQWWHLLSQAGKERRSKVGDANAVSSNRIFELLMAPRANMVRKKYASVVKADGPPHRKLETKDTGDQEGGMQHLKAGVPLPFSKPHHGAIKWMMRSVLDMQRRVEAECVSLWDFLSRMRSDVEVVSAGEPHTPWRCVLGFSDTVLLRVRSPSLAAQALQSKGFDAVAAIACTWSGSGGGGDSTDLAGKRPSSPTLREVIFLPGCPKCEELAHHALFLPLYPEMKWRNREKIFRVMQSTLSSSLFGSPAGEFRQHVMRAPLHHAYRSTAVDALIASCRQHRCSGTGLFVDPQPLLLWCLLGPVPGYLLSKL